MDFIHIWHDGRYRSKIFISTIPDPGVTLVNFHKKVRVKCFALKFIRPHIYTPDIGSMWGYIVFAFPFRPFVRSYVRSFVCSFRHRVKVYALKFIRSHILKTL